MAREDFKRRFSYLGTPGLWSFSVLFLLLGGCILVYYFGELVDFAGWTALRLDFFYGVHDIHRLLFLAPILYAAYVFGIRAVIIITILTAASMLFRALYISPFPDPVERAVIFCVIAGSLGFFTARGCSRLRVRRAEEVCGKTAVGTEKGILLTGPNRSIMFMSPEMKEEFGQDEGSQIQMYLRLLDKPDQRNFKHIGKYNVGVDRWEYKLPDGRTYDVQVIPYIDIGEIQCQLSVFRGTGVKETASVGSHDTEINAGR